MTAIRLLQSLASVLLLGAVASAHSASPGKWERYHASRKEIIAIDSISAKSLSANLTFLASDLLEGRGTPSRGLDIAAEFIATQFKHAGLEPVGDSYFQVTDWVPLRGSPIEGPPIKVRNVIGLLRGSDPKLADTYVLITAHYDHLGMKAGEGDVIFNGANDDGSGAVSILELASSLGSLQERPKRSIVFMTYYGEERGMVGSRYYASHPLFPIEKTVANINLEQVGRVDDSDNPGPNLASVTGMDFSEVGTILEIAGRRAGVRIFKNAANSDTYFSRSDNLPLAALGVPAHTVSTAYEFSDYHKVSDQADKIDYANMARLNRALALALLMIANHEDEPLWNFRNAGAAPFASARKR